MIQTDRMSEELLRQEFSKKKISSLFAKYAIPSAICLLFMGIQTIIDGIFVGNYAGANALAGINIVIPAYTLISSLIIIIGIGCQTIMGISNGEGNFKRSCDALYSSFIFLIIFTIITAILFLIFGKNIVIISGADDILYDYSVNYLTTIAYFFPVFAIMTLGDYYLKSQGKPYMGLAILAISVVINIILDFIFIAMLELGTKGAALATGISFSISAIISLFYIFRPKANVNVQKGNFDLKLLGNMLYNGSSEGVSELSAGITLFLFNRALMALIGPSGVAAFTSINYLLYVGITVFVGMSDGIIPVLSYNYGASNLKRVLKLLKTNILVNISLGAILFLLTFWGGKNIITLFFAHSPESAGTIELAVKGSRICSFAFLFNGINIAICSFFTSIADAKISVIISMLRGFIFIVIGIYLYPMLFEINGIWLAIPLSELFTLLIASFLLKRRTKIHKLKQKIYYK